MEMKRTPFRQCRLAFTDVETTGLNVYQHEIVDLSVAITDLRGNIISERQWYMHPRWPEIAEQQALDVNGYTHAEWEKRGVVDHKTAITEYVEYCNDCIFVASNVCFDWALLEVEMRRAGIEWQGHYHRLDVMSMGYPVALGDPALTGLSMSKMCDRYGISSEHAHTGKGDVRRMIELFKTILSKLEPCVSTSN
jgi:DNA polymerase III alpha subunit (gram-positive type)